VKPSIDHHCRISRARGNSRFISAGHTGAITGGAHPVDFRQEVPAVKFNQTNPFPTDKRLRDDIGLPPIGEPPPPLQLIPYASAYFPNDDRLRDDIGLPPLGAALNVDSETPAPAPAATPRITRSGASLIGVVDGCVKGVTAMLRAARTAAASR